MTKSLMVFFLSIRQTIKFFTDLKMKKKKLQFTLFWKQEKQIHLIQNQWNQWNFPKAQPIYIYLDITLTSKEEHDLFIEFFSRSFDFIHKTRSKVLGGPDRPLLLFFVLKTEFVFLLLFVFSLSTLQLHSTMFHFSSMSCTQSGNPLNEARLLVLTPALIALYKGTGPSNIGTERSPLTHRRLFPKSPGIIADVIHRSSW